MVPLWELGLLAAHFHSHVAQVQLAGSLPRCLGAS